jgi:hypothetical protein
MRPWRGRSSSFGHCIAGLLALAVLVFATAARCEREAIVRVRSSNSALDERLAAELSTLGLPVEEVDGSDPGAPLEQIARARGARAAVRVVEHENAIELWVEPRKEGAPPIHQNVPMDPRRGWNLAAVSALEILRADLLEVREAAAAPPRLQAPQPVLDDRHPAPPLSPTRPALLWAHVAAGAESSPGGLGTSAEVLAELRLDALPWFDVAAFGAFDPAPAQIASAEGVASARHAIVGGAAEVRRRVVGATVSVGVGGVVALFWLKGEAPAPGYGGQSVSIATAGPLLRVCASLDVTPALRVRGEIGGGVTVPHAVVRFAGRQVADWGQPFGLITLGLELGLLP